MKNIIFNVEKTSTGYSGWAEIDGSIAVTTGGDMDELKSNALESVNLLLEELGMEPISIQDIQFPYEIQAFFEKFKDINTTAFAKRVPINRSLLSQYINGSKIPSVAMCKKITIAINQLGIDLIEATLV